ncbi:hypothetical protein BOX15_Mlig000308g1, partial [Macrostomum lignano]
GAYMLDLLERLLVHGDLSVGSQLFSLDNETVLSEADEALAYVRLQCLSGTLASNGGCSQGQNLALTPGQSSAVELCVARICRSLKETGKLEAHLPALLKLLARCAELPLAGNVSGSDGCGSDPLPVRLASDLLSCLFQARHSSSMLSSSLPVLVKLLNCPNSSLRRTVSSYLSLASAGRAQLLTSHATPLIIAACEGNLSLVGLLCQLQQHSPDAFAKHSDDLILLLRSQPVQDSRQLKRDLLRLLAAMSLATPDCLLPHARALLGQLDADTAECGLPVLVNIQRRNPAACLPLVSALSAVHPAWPLAVRSLAEIFARLLAAYPSQFEPVADVLTAHLALANSGRLACQLLACLLQLARLNPRLFAASLEARIPNLRAALATAGYRVEAAAAAAAAGASNSSLVEAGQLLDSLECLAIDCLQQQQQQQQQQLQLQQQQEHHGSSQHVVSCLMLPNSNRSSTGGGGSSRRIERARSQAMPSASMVAYFGSGAADDADNEPVWTEQHRQQAITLSSDAAEKFCSKHYRKLVSFVSRAKLRLPAPCAIWMDVKKRRLLSNKRRLCLGFRCEANSERCLNTCPTTPLFSMLTAQPRLWLHLLFLIKQTELGHAVSQRHPDMLPIRSLWCSLLDEAEFLPTVTSAFPALSQLDSMLRELHRKRFFDLFEFNGAYGMWCCFECNHSPARPSGPMRCEIKKSGSLGGWRVSQISLQEADQMLTVVTPRVTKSLSLKAVKPRRRANHDAPRELQLELQSGGTLRVRRIQPVEPEPPDRCSTGATTGAATIDYRYTRTASKQQNPQQHQQLQDDANWFHSMQCALSRSLSAQYLRHKRRSAATTGVAA